MLLVFIGERAGTFCKRTASSNYDGLPIGDGFALRSSLLVHESSPQSKYPIACCVKLASLLLGQSFGNANMV